MMAHDILGPRYQAETLYLSGGAVATLVRRARREGTSPRGAILFLHGFVDYFFQTHLAEHYADLGWDFYGIDLRRYGRSLREGEVAWYTDDLAEYDADLDAAVRRIRDADGHTRLIVMGHSTGGLILPLWAERRRDRGWIDGIILNSPWLDLQEPWYIRTIGTWFIRLIGRVRPMAVVRQGLDSVYAQSIHESQRGEWAFDNRWKPLTAQKVYYGFLAAVRRGQALLHRGLKLTIPVLLLRSDKSLLKAPGWSDAVATSDVVLDVAQMHQWAGKLGTDVTEVTIVDGVHDLFLSRRDVRDEAFGRVDEWLNARFPGDEANGQMSAPMPAHSDRMGPRA